MLGLLLLALPGATPMAAEAGPLAVFEHRAERANYCFYTRSLALQDLAASGNALQALPRLQRAQAWQDIVDALLPDSSARRDAMLRTLEVFNARVEAAGGDGVAARARVIGAADAPCTALFSRLQSRDLSPRAPAAEVDGAPPVAKPAVPAVAAPPPPRPAGSPFVKDVFAPGWRGDLDWQGISRPVRVTLTSLDQAPPGSASPAIHANLRLHGSNARPRCVGALVETGSAPDGLTLHLGPAPGNGCARAWRRISIRGLAPALVRLEVHGSTGVLASGTLQPVSAAARLAMAPPEPAPAQEQETAPATVAAPVQRSPAEVPDSTLADAAVAVPEAAPEAAAQRACATCLEVDAGLRAPAPDPLRSAADAPLRGRFRWNWHTTGVLTVRGQGTLTRTTAPGADHQRFRLEIDSEYRSVCTGELQEVGRSAGGYLMHLAVQPRDDGRACDPVVTHGYLLPFTPRGETEAGALWIKLYNNRDQLVSSAMLRSAALDPPLPLDAALAGQAFATMQEMKARAEEQRRADKLADFLASPAYPRLAPLYTACMQAAPGILGVVGHSAYCQCISQKFGIGRLSTAELDGYSNNFQPLVERMYARYNEENRLYNRLGETCRRCSAPDKELQPHCAEQDWLLYAPQDYAELIRLLDTEDPIVDSTDFYKKVFYRTYLQGFSIYCPEQIQDPVTFEYVVKEFDVGDPWADPDGRTVQRTVTDVERRYAGRYQRYRDDTNRLPEGTSVAGLVQQSMITSQADLTRRMRDTRRLIETERENRAAVRAHLEGQCTSASVQRVYANLLHLVD